MMTIALRPYRYWALRYRRQWVDGLVVSFAQPLLYLGAIGFGLGRLVDANRPETLAGVHFSAYIAPGLMAGAAMQTASRDSSWPVMSAIREKNIYQAMLATPLGVGDVLLGHLAWTGTRIALASSAYFAVVVAFGLAASPVAVFAIPAAVVTGLAVAAPIMAYVATIVRDDQGLALVERLIILPMFLLSGTFFPVSQLPVALRVLAYGTPLWHGAELCRQLLLDRVDAASALVHMAYLTALLLVGTLAARRTYQRRLVL
jgi:lipooligosaccharide transport system permease protein